jgi:hypothetical protein
VSSSAGCIYPQSHQMKLPIMEALDSIVANQAACTSFYLDTVEGMSGGLFEGEDHHQGLARTHRLSDGSVFWFLAHSEVDEGDQGSLSQYRYDGPLDEEHIEETSPLTVAPMAQLLPIDEQHPSDIDFLPDVNHADAGYLFVVEEFVNRRVTVYRWAPGQDLAVQGRIFQGFPATIPDTPLLKPPGSVVSNISGPNFLFVDRAGDYVYLGVASDHWGWGQLLRARAVDLFPKCAPGAMEVSAFKPAGMFPFPVLGRTGACQVKLVRDGTDQWFLLAFHSDPPDDPNGSDHVDVYGVAFEPFAISYLLGTVHVSFKAGDTGYANTGTHYVEPSGRLLLSSSYRWAEDPGIPAGYVSRVDELPSSF